MKHKVSDMLMQSLIAIQQQQSACHRFMSLFFHYGKIVPSFNTYETPAWNISECKSTRFLIFSTAEKPKNSNN